MTSLFEKSPYRNSQHTKNESKDRRVAAITHIARSATPREIAWLIAKVAAGDPDVTSALALDGVHVDDLRELLRGQSVDPLLEQFRWSGQWVGTSPRLFLLAERADRALAFMEKETLDPFRCFAYDDPAEVKEHVAINDAAEVIIIGGAS